jgi:putative ABC transport system permease protein
MPGFFADRWCSLLLRLYPRPFRNRFEDGMRDALWRDYEMARASGAGAVLTFWFLTSIDAVRFGYAERRPRLRGGLSMSSFFIVDLRDALRSLKAAPVVTLVAVITLALGIGANAALFSLLNSLLLKNLPVRDPQRLVVIDKGPWTNPIWEQIRERRQDVFEDAFAWSSTRFNLAARGQTDYVEGVWASGRMFEMLGVQPALGRVFTEADDTRTGGRDGAVAVISYGFWQRRMGGTPDALGRHLTVDGLDVTIIGVAPRGFLGPDVGRSADVILPVGAVALSPTQSKMLDGRSTWWLEIMGRLKPGQSVDDAASRLNALRPQIREATMPERWRAKDREQYMSEPLVLVAAGTGLSDLRATYRKPLQIVLGIVAGVLAIACANLASLLLARAASRRHELSVRLALGASRFRLAKLLLAETAILAIAGASLGLLVAKWGSALLVRQLATPASGVTLDLSLDWRVLSFTTLITALTAVIFGLAPALGVIRLSPTAAIKEQTRTVTGDRRFGVRSMLVCVQIALSLALVVGGVLFVRTLTALSRTPLGFEPSGLVAINVDTQDAVPSRDARLQLFERVRDAAASTGGVSGAAISILVPAGSMRWNTLVEATPGAKDLRERQRIPWVNVVSPGWFKTFGMRIIDGRDFDARDTRQAERAVIVNEAFVRRMFPGGGAVGQEIRSGIEGPTVLPYRIVGVVNDSIYVGPRRGFEPVIYVAFAQLDQIPGAAVITARAANGRAETLARDLAAVVTRTDPGVTFSVRFVDAQLRAAIRQERLVALIAGFFGALALVLAAIGLYGVASHSVAVRRSEIGIRMALGADPRGVVRLVLKRLGWLLVSGMVLGIALSWWTVRLIEQLLFGMRGRDPLTFALAALVLFLAGLLAGWLPARRAARIDPVQALREA